MAKPSSRTGQAELASQDLQFAQEAAIGGLKEVTTGELAQGQAKDENVMQFGERTRFTGSMRFVYLHLALFGFWIVANLGWVPGVSPWTPRLSSWQ